MTVKHRGSVGLQIPAPSSVTLSRTLSLSVFNCKMGLKAVLTSEGHYKDKLSNMKHLAQSLASSNRDNVNFVIILETIFPIAHLVP